MKAALRKQLVDQASTAAYRELDQIEKQLAVDEIPDESVTELNAKLKALVVGVAGTVEGLLRADDPRDAETLLAPVLRRIKGESERERIEAVLARFEQAKTPAFNVALARWLSHRPTSVFIELAPKLDARSLGEGAAVELGEVLARLWLEASEEESGDASTGMALIGELRHQGASVQVERLAEGIRNSFSSSAVDEGELSRLRGRFGLLEEVARIGLIPTDETASIVVDFATRTLRENPASEQDEAIADFLQACFAFAADSAPPVQLEASREALVESAWISAQSPQAETIGLQIAAGLARGDAMPLSPLSPAQIAELAKAHGPRFSPAAILWLERFEPTPGQVAKALDPMLRGALPAAMAKAVTAYSERQSPLGRYRLVKRSIEWPSLRNPPPSLLRALGIRGADPEKVTAAIVERFERALNHRQRQAVLNIWRAFAPADDASRRTLIKKVFIPLSQQGVGGYRLARKYLQLCKDPPRGTKGKLIEALEDAPRRKEIRSMHRQMEQVGLRNSK